MLFVPVFWCLQYRISALSRDGADRLTFPDEESGTNKVVAEYFGQKYFPLRVRIA